VNGPDGPEERTADLEEASEREYERIEVIEERADETVLATSREVLDATRDARDTIARLLEENESLHEDVARLRRQLRAAQAHA
jgi:hypothetical protein